MMVVVVGIVCSDDAIAMLPLIATMTLLVTRLTN